MPLPVHPTSNAAALAARTPFDALMTVADRPDTVFTRGAGSWLWDATGRRHFDAVQGWAVNTLGHAPPEDRRSA